MVAVALSAFIITGCASDISNTQKGAGIGAVLGALAGKGTGDNDKKRYVWGAALGALAGGAIGTPPPRQRGLRGMQRSRSKDVVAAIDKKLLRRSRSKDVVSTSTPTQVSRRSKSKDVVSSTQLSHRSRSKDNVSFTDTSRSSLSLSTGKRGSSRANPPRATSTGSKSPYHRPPPGMSMGAAAVGTSPRRPASTVPTSSSMPSPEGLLQKKDLW